MPRTNAAILAARFARQAYPEFLFNHCIRTYLFGALALQRQKISFDADAAFVAAALHDLGLLPRFASKAQSFEIDGANTAETFARRVGMSPQRANVVWQSVALHDARFALARHAGAEAVLVALGTGSDVIGPELESDDEKKQAEEIVSAFPRLRFKSRFTALLVDQCKRKPTSQRGTWLEGLCRQHVPGAWTDMIENEIAAAPFRD